MKAERLDSYFLPIKLLDFLHLLIDEQSVKSLSDSKVMERTRDKGK